MPKIADKSKNGTKEWKDKYYECVRELDQLERDAQDVKQNLTRGIQKLSYAIPADGEAEELLVDGLRTSCREEDVAAILQCVKQISDAVIDGSSPNSTAQSDNLSREESFVSEFLASLIAKLDSLRLPIRLLASLKEDLAVGANSPDAHENVSTILVDFFVKLQQFDDNEANLIGSKLSSVVLALPHAPDMANDACVTADQVQAPHDSEELVEFLNQIAELARKIRTLIDHEQENVESFLSELTEKLQGIHQFLQGTDAAWGESDRDGAEMQEKIELNVQNIRSSVADAESVQELRKIVNNRLDCIDSDLRGYREKERSQYLKISGENEKMLGKLAALERESEQLKQVIEDEKKNSRTDRLTGLNNRLAFDLELEKEYVRWKRSHGDLSVLFIDIDFFKRVNDTYGHKVGDQVLQAVSKLAQQSLRESDFLARYGGEEFVAILPDTSCESARIVAEKIRSNVESKNFKYGDNVISVTVSCGVAQYVDGDSEEIPLIEADKALYRAKNQGRNQTVCATR